MTLISVEACRENLSSSHFSFSLMFPLTPAHTWSRPLWALFGVDAAWESLFLQTLWSWAWAHRLRAVRVLGWGEELGQSYSALLLWTSQQLPAHPICSHLTLQKIISGKSGRKRTVSSEEYQRISGPEGTLSTQLFLHFFRRENRSLRKLSHWFLVTQCGQS